MSLCSARISLFILEYLKYWDERRSLRASTAVHQVPRIRRNWVGTDGAVYPVHESGVIVDGGMGAPDDEQLTIAMQSTMVAVHGSPGDFELEITMNSSIKE